MTTTWAAQLQAMTGVATGALLAYLATAVHDRARWRREQAARWDVARMETYFGYAQALKSSVHVAIRIAAGRGLGEVASPLEAGTGLALLSELDLERVALWEKVVLLGDAATIAAGRDWHEQAWRLAWFAEGRTTDEAQWAATLKAVERARHEFYTCARRNLGVRGETPAMSGWTRRQEVWGGMAPRP